MAFVDWLSLFAVALLGAASPGPSLAVVVKNTLNNGKTSGFLTAWSHASGIGIYAILTVFGLAILIKQNPIIFKFISYSGALYLIWLGIKALKSNGGTFKNGENGKRLTYIQSLRDGFLISLLNPKIGLFFIALFSQVMDEHMGLNGKIITLLTPFFTDGLWYTFVVMLISYGKILNVLRKNALWIDRITGIVLILVGLKIVFI